MKLITSISLKRSSRTLVLTSTMAMLLSACMVGPNFQKPAAPTTQHYDAQAEQKLGGDDKTVQTQHIDLGKSIEGNWWTSLGSTKLDAVMNKAVTGNFDLEAADATIAQANDAVASAAGRLRPQVGFGASGGRGRENSGGVTATSNFYSVGPQVSYDFDIFGGNKRLVEERKAQAEFQKHKFDAAYLTVTGDVASEAIQLASARAQITAVQVLIADDQKNLELVQGAHEHGSATQLDVALANTQLAQDQTLLPPLTQQRDVAKHALSILVGKSPGEWTAPDFDLSDFTLPQDIPVSLPSELARNRPDILEAEAELHAQSAAIGVATADMYPHLTLSASLATAGPGIGTLWGIAGGLAGPLYAGGTLKANRQASVDDYKATYANYQQTVIKSLGQVADVLQGVNHDAEEYAAQEQALSAAQTSLQLNQQGYQVGETSVLQVLDAQRSYQRALIGEIQAKTARYLDNVQLSVALGGNANGASEQRVAYNGKL
ncbi:efflux transporter outer membrane subunit [Dyella flava]|uniref:Efflux transporter outer membrane subunit n=1 Tax=Dyella flava TaxID=1920170 RepID=A0ABS2JYG0_9GAMM|nr:efflux transporter outer membrane subunit [Dyella flava]MBM7124035.1 efflux transporter outer membrane subunit [Dyella flava]GLQ52358.1 RND transporter [Dyella flava]